MKKLWIALAMLLSIFLAGCGSSTLGGHDAKAEINATLDRYAAAYKAKDADAIADVYTYPCKNISEDGAESIITSRDQMKFTMAFGFAMLGQIYDVQIINRTITISGDSALVTADVFADADVLGSRFRTTSQAGFTLVNSGGWKISVVHTKSSTTSPVN